MTNEEWLKSLLTRPFAEFVRMEILDYLPCWDWDDEDRRICNETGDECRFACLQSVIAWLEQEHKDE